MNIRERQPFELCPVYPPNPDIGSGIHDLYTTTGISHPLLEYLPPQGSINEIIHDAKQPPDPQTTIGASCPKIDIFEIYATSGTTVIIVSERRTFMGPDCNPRVSSREAQHVDYTTGSVRDASGTTLYIENPHQMVKDFRALMVDPEGHPNPRRTRYARFPITPQAVYNAA